jgi:hypothetical protein
VGRNLRVGEEEDDAAVVCAGLDHGLLEVVAPLGLAVRLRDLDLHARQLRHAGRQPRQRLPPWHTHMHVLRLTSYVTPDLYTLRITNKYGRLTRNKILMKSGTTLKYHDVYSKYVSLLRFQIDIR